MKNKYLVLGLYMCLVFASCEKNPTNDDDQQLKQGLLAHYPFNGNANDASGNGYNLSIKGPVPIDNRFGEVNKAYKFNGTSDVLVIPKIAKADSLREFTISVWVKVENLTQNSIVSFAGKAPNTCSYDIGFYNVAPVYLTMHHMIINSDQYGCTSSIIRDTIDNPLNKWGHMVFVQRYNVTYPAFPRYEYIHYYDNKKLDLGGAEGGLVTSFNQGGVVGAKNTNRDFDNGNFSHFKGAIDDIRIYNRALSDAEVAQLYNLRE